MAWNYDNGYFPKSTPRAAKGGIKAQSKRGGFGQSWWAKRWIQVLESFNIGARLQRGRSYARSGQVLDIHIEAGLVTAKVQGSRPKPYNVRLRVETLSRQETERLSATLSGQVLFAAKLLAGEMPQDIEQVFTAAGLSLFPGRHSDLHTECSCPDWSNPCKHVAAVYYLLGEEFDRDPFLLFKLRGIDRERLLASLDERELTERHAGVDEPDSAGEKSTSTAAASTKRQKRSVGKTKATASTSAPQSVTPPAEPLPEPLSCDASAFWNGAELPNDFWGEVQSPSVAAALPRRIGHFPFWRGIQPLLEAIEPLYTSAGVRGLRLFMGEAEN
jgi:uncharacterized Zn finger protein